MKRHGTTRALVLGITISVAGLFVSGTGMAAGDASREGTMIKRVFSYDRDLRNSEKVVVLVVTSDRSAPGLEDVIAAFRANGLFPAVITPADLSSPDLASSLTPEATVVYVADRSSVDLVKAFAAEKGFLTVSVHPVLAEAGDVSVSVTVEGDRPEIIVNLPRLREEGHELSSELLSLARVIR